MPDQLFIGKPGHGIKSYFKPFNIDNDAFQTLFNAYVWRGQVKRKRGTEALARLEFQVVLVDTTSFPWQNTSISLSSGNANLITGIGLSAGPTIVPDSINLTSNGNTYTEPTNPNGTLLKNGSQSSPVSTINYATGAIFLQGSGAKVRGSYDYFPLNPVMGLRDFQNTTTGSEFAIQVAFDTTNAYQVNQSTFPPFYYNVTFYKNSNVPFEWSNQDYAQFYTTNYQNALWTTNNKPGLNLVDGAYVSGSGTTTITFTFTYPTFSPSSGQPFKTLVVGDYLWFNEWPTNNTINGVTGIVSAIVNAATGTYVVTFSQNVTVSVTGIAQLLTNTIIGQDGIKWYDGDPTGGTGLPTNTGLGWVNFAPPLTATTVGIDDEVFELYYLVGALSIIPFKDRLLFCSPYIQTSSGEPIQLYDTILWSWNGTPYYTVDASGAASLVPFVQNGAETAALNAYYVDQTGLGGYLPAGIDRPIKTIVRNEDVILVGFGGTGHKARFIYTGNDLDPFTFYSINATYPSNSTFSAITLDRGMIDIGSLGICITSQQSAERIDLDIPDDVFDIQTLNNGFERVNAIRDFFREWIYFSYPVQGNSTSNKYPAQTFLYNYRDNTWAIFYENFTAHGNYRASNYFTWATCPFLTWAQWNQPWNAGSSTAFFSSICAGNPQGFVIIKGDTTGEAPTGAISAIALATGLYAGNTQITSVNHCVNVGDYLYFLSAIGSTFLNGNIYKVIAVIDANNFVVDAVFVAGTYLGLGTFTRLSQPLIQTKQFPLYWEQGRQARIGVQKYLLDTTANSQITLNMYLSQDSNTVWNNSNIVPSNDVTNSTLLYSQVLYTCPESTNIGLTPANTNLQMPTASTQAQIWHRINTSLIGDTVQLGFTLNDSQMRNLNNATAEITLHAIHLTVSPGPLLS